MSTTTRMGWDTRALVKLCAKWNPEDLGRPLHWRKPRHVECMSDLFHERVPDEFIDRVFAVMALTPQHQYQVLTKRPERMRAYLRLGRPPSVGGRILTHTRAIEMPGGRRKPLWDWPLSNVWLGVSVEDQRAADERIPVLLETPAAVRFLSCEPLLGPVELALGLPSMAHELLGIMLTTEEGRPNVVCTCGAIASGVPGQTWAIQLSPDRKTATVAPSLNWPGHFHTTNPAHPAVIEYGDWFNSRLDWVIVGGESGPGARPCDLAWIRDIVGQCQAADVPVFVKQLGARPYDGLEAWQNPLEGPDEEPRWLLLRDRKGGDPEEWPADLRVREWPR